MRTRYIVYMPVHVYDLSMPKVAIAHLIKKSFQLEILDILVHQGAPLINKSHYHSLLASSVVWEVDVVIHNTPRRIV